MDIENKLKMKMERLIQKIKEDPEEIDKERIIERIKKKFDNTFNTIRKNSEKE